MQVETTKVFKSGGSQAVRIPQSMRFPEGVEEVFISSSNGRLTIMPKKKNLLSFFEKYKDAPPIPDFLPDREDRPPEDRELL